MFGGWLDLGSSLAFVTRDKRWLSGDRAGVEGCTSIDSKIVRVIRVVLSLGFIGGDFYEDWSWV